MKTFFQAVIATITFQLIFFLCLQLVTYKMMKNYAPATPYVENDTIILQNEIVFGVIASPYFFFLTFIGLTGLNAMVIITYKIIVNKY